MGRGWIRRSERHSGSPLKPLEAWHPHVQQVLSPFKIVLQGHQVAMSVVLPYNHKTRTKEKCKSRRKTSAQAKLLTERFRQMWSWPPMAPAPTFHLASLRWFLQIVTIIVMSVIAVFVSNWHHLVPFRRPALQHQVWKLDVQRIQCENHNFYGIQHSSSKLWCWLQWW